MIGFSFQTDGVNVSLLVPGIFLAVIGIAIRGAIYNRRRYTVVEVSDPHYQIVAQSYPNGTVPLPQGAVYQGYVYGGQQQPAMMGQGCCGAPPSAYQASYQPYPSAFPLTNPPTKTF